MIFRRQPEKDGNVLPLLLEIALHLQQRRKLDDRVERTAGEADLLSGHERDALAAGPALHVVFDERAPAPVGFDEGVRYLLTVCGLRFAGALGTREKTRIAVEPYCPRVVPSKPPTSTWVFTVLTKCCARNEVKNRCFELKS